VKRADRKKAAEDFSWAYHLFYSFRISVDTMGRILRGQTDVEEFKEKYHEEYLVWRTKRRLLGEK
jgi:hypothetical protein